MRAIAEQVQKGGSSKTTDGPAQPTDGENTHYSPTSPEQSPSAPISNRRKQRAKQPQRPKKIRATLYMPAELLEEARDATVFLAGYPARLTLAAIAEKAIRAELARLKKRYNDGKDFPQREENLQGGRPIGS